MLIISQGLLFGLQHSPFLHKWLSFHVQGIFHLINYWCRKCISVLTQAINSWHKEVQYLCAKCYIDDLRWHKSVVFIFLKAFPWLSAERGENICHYSFLFRYLIFIEKETWWQSDMTTCCLVPLGGTKAGWNRGECEKWGVNSCICCVYPLNQNDMFSYKMIHCFLMHLLYGYILTLNYLKSPWSSLTSGQLASECNTGGQMPNPGVSGTYRNNDLPVVVGHQHPPGRSDSLIFISLVITMTQTHSTHGIHFLSHWWPFLLCKFTCQWKQVFLR